MTRPLTALGGSLAVLAAIVGPPVYTLREQAQTRNFRVVREGVLYRSGQMTTDGLRRILNDYGIRTVICLRDGTTRQDQDEETFCDGENIWFVRILPGRWGDMGDGAPAEEGVRKFREVLAEPRYHPVLVHCLAGIHRTGIFTAIYRMEFEGWTNAQAMDEMRACGYVELDDHLDVTGFLESYRPTAQTSGAAPPPRSEAPFRQRPLAVRNVTAKVTGTSRHKPAAADVTGAQHRRPTQPRVCRSRSRHARPAATVPEAAGAGR
jgi:tyrosine-protein phosphatase SIW14